MGLGKTVSVIGALNTDPSWRRVLIIAPESLLPMREAELVRWLVVDCTVVVATAKDGIPSDPWDVLLMNYDIVHKFRKDRDERDPFDAPKYAIPFGATDGVAPKIVEPVRH
jgi:hypothetical protein